MTLDEWLIEHRVTGKALAQRIGAHYNMVTLMRRRRVKPTLRLALAIYYVTRGEVDMFEILPEEEQEKIKNMVPF